MNIIITSLIIWDFVTYFNCMICQYCVNNNNNWILFYSFAVSTCSSRERKSFGVKCLLKRNIPIELENYYKVFKFVSHHSDITFSNKKSGKSCSVCLIFTQFIYYFIYKHLFLKARELRWDTASQRSHKCNSFACIFYIGQLYALLTRCHFDWLITCTHVKSSGPYTGNLNEFNAKLAMFILKPFLYDVILNMVRQYRTIRRIVRIGYWSYTGG